MNSVIFLFINGGNEFDYFLHNFLNTIQLYNYRKYFGHKCKQPKKHEWQQRVVRIYDPDYHIIEIGESMSVIAKRYLANGYSVEETSKIIQHPIEFVEQYK